MSRTYRITVNVAPSAYEVVVERGILARIGEVLRELTPAGKVCLATDSNVAGHHLPLATTALVRQFQVVQCILPAGEQHKTIDNIMRMYDAFLPAGIDRHTPLAALGGGVVGDMTGFAAATILRGVPFVQIPTSLLAMVDASVGGKTGIDHPCGKNLIGAFHQPIGVIIDPEVLLTLPRRELVGGLAECIKHDIIRDAVHFGHLTDIIPGALEGNVSALAALVAHNVQIKARVVEADPLEKGERAHLNLGHTFGHAFEKISQYRYSHGEAVALGMVAAARLALKLNLLQRHQLKGIEQVIELAGLPTGGMDLDVDECMRAMIYDKKVVGGRIRFVLPEGIGAAVIRDDVPDAEIREAVASLKG
jgi:3-dehydroquinate synthase